MNKLKFSPICLIIISLSNLSFSMGTVLAKTENKSQQNTLIKAKGKVVNEVLEKVSYHRYYQYQIPNENNLQQHQLYIAQRIERPIEIEPRVRDPRKNPTGTEGPTRGVGPSDPRIRDQYEVIDKLRERTEKVPITEFPGNSINNPRQIEPNSIRSARTIGFTVNGTTVALVTMTTGSIVKALVKGNSYYYAECQSRTQTSRTGQVLLNCRYAY